MAGSQVSPRPRGSLYVKQAGLPVLISAPRSAKHRLMAEVAKREQAGEFERIDRTAFWDAEAGRWRIRVRRLAPPPARWRRPALIAAGAMTLLGALAAAGWWLLATLAALPGLVFLGLVLVVFVAFVLARVGSREPEVNVQVNVSVRR
jgi:hypothetical protein